MSKVFKVIIISPSSCLRYFTDAFNELSDKIGLSISGKVATYRFDGGVSVNKVDETIRSICCKNNVRCSQGGYAISRFPFEYGDDNIQFDNDVLEYHFE